MATSVAERTGFADFLRRNREQAVAQWEQEVRRVPPAKPLTIDALRDSMPTLVDSIVDMVERGELGPEPGVSEKHARARLEQGFSIQQIGEEYRILRSALLRFVHADPNILLLDEAIDASLSRAVSQYCQSRFRTLQALERLSQEALRLQCASLQDLLRRFLSIILDSLEAVDIAVIYLREWDRLVLRAAVGDPRTEEQFSVAMGEGIAGRVAQQQRAYFTPCVATDPLASPALARPELRGMYAVPLMADGELVGVAKMASRSASDFSQSDRHLFEDMAHRAAVLIRQRRLAEEREVFLGVLGHDLRSPINSVLLGAAYLSKREPLSETGVRVLHRLETSVRRMDRMVASLADFAKARFGGGLTLEVHVTDLAETLGQLLGELRAQHEGRAIELDARGDLVGEWDAVRLAELVTNLVHNAIAYGDPNRPVVIAADGTDRIEVVLSVHNEGAPIPQGLMPHLFDAFRRGRVKSGGTGLGLYIVRHIAQAHRGTVAVHSTEADGTTFTVRLPRWAPDADPKAP